MGRTLVDRAMWQADRFSDELAGLLAGLLDLGPW